MPDTHAATPPPPRRIQVHADHMLARLATDSTGHPLAKTHSFENAYRSDSDDLPDRQAARGGPS